MEERDAVCQQLDKTKSSLQSAEDDKLNCGQQINSLSAQVGCTQLNIICLSTTLFTFHLSSLQSAEDDRLNCEQQINSLSAQVGCTSSQLYCLHFTCVQSYFCHFRHSDSHICYLVNYILIVTGPHHVHKRLRNDLFCVCVT